MSSMYDMIAKMDNAKRIMGGVISRNRANIEAVVGPIVYHGPDSWVFELRSNYNERISVATPPDTLTLEILYKGDIHYPEESELPSILLQMKNGNFEVDSDDESLDPENDYPDPNEDLDHDPDDSIEEIYKI